MQKLDIMEPATQTFLDRLHFPLPAYRVQGNMDAVEPAPVFTLGVFDGRLPSNLTSMSRYQIANICLGIGNPQGRAHQVRDEHSQPQVDG
jgi:hypothetical protein